MINKILYSLTLIFALTACSMNDVIALVITPTPPPPPATGTPQPPLVETQGPPRTSTAIPTFTSTPTLVGLYQPLDSTSGATLALPTLILIPTATSGPKISFNQSGSIIMSVAVSTETLFWGYCDATKHVDFDARIVNNPRLIYVLLFWRLVDKGGNQSTAWGGGAIMQKTTSGFYTYRVTPDMLIHYDEFKDAWIEYQVVAVGRGLNILESSPVYENTLSLQKCLTIEVEE